MRDSYVLLLFALFIASGTFLAYTGKVEPQLIMTPIVTGFLGLLASTRPKYQNFHVEESLVVDGNLRKSNPDFNENPRKSFTNEE